MKRKKREKEEEKELALVRVKFKYTLHIIYDRPEWDKFELEVTVEGTIVWRTWDLAQQAIVDAVHDGIENWFDGEIPFAYEEVEVPGTESGFSDVEVEEILDAKTGLEKYTLSITKGRQSAKSHIDQELQKL